MAIEIKENFFLVFYFIIKKKSILISSVCENCKILKCLPMRNEGIDDWTIRQSLLNGRRGESAGSGGKAGREERQIRKGWLDPRDGRGRKDALFRFFYSIMQINVRYIKLSTGMAKGRQSRETIFMLLRKQKSAGANLSFLPSRFPFYGFVVPFRCRTNIVTSGMVPPWSYG